MRSSLALSSGKLVALPARDVEQKKDTEFSVMQSSQSRRKASGKMARMRGIQKWKNGKIGKLGEWEIGSTGKLEKRDKYNEDSITVCGQSVMRYMHSSLVSHRHAPYRSSRIFPYDPIIFSRRGAFLQS